MKPWKLLTILLAACVLAACVTGQRRVSEPAASLQQLTVAADGSWSIDLRVQNYSSIPMRFDSVQLELQIAGEPADPRIDSIRAGPPARRRRPRGRSHPGLSHRRHTARSA